MSLKFALRSAVTTGLLMVLLSADAFSALPTVTGRCNVNAIAWKIPNDGLSTNEQSPVAIPHTRTNFTMAAPGCIVVQVTAYATTSVSGKIWLYLVLDDGVVTNQIFGEGGARTRLLTTTQIFWDLSAGAHHLNLQAHSDNGDGITVVPLNITVQYRK
jgi:hypothetical protein